MNIEELKNHKRHYEVFRELSLEVMNELFAIAENSMVDKPKRAKAVQEPAQEDAKVE